MTVHTKEQWLNALTKVTKGYMSTGGPKRFYESGYNIMKQLKEVGAWKFGDTILDIGCGNGRFPIHLTDYDIQYIGLDVIPESIDFCRDAFLEWPQFHFELLRCRNERYNPYETAPAEEACFPVDNASVDSVLALSLFTHLETRAICKRYLEETYRVLKPSGKFWCTWFRSPPNDPCSSAKRRVYEEWQIIELIKPFRILHSEGGLTSQCHDQWKLLLERP